MEEDTMAICPCCQDSLDTLAHFFVHPGDFRSFELEIDENPIFVNAHYLAQLSPFFARLCFDDFKEKREKKAFIGDEKYDDILRLMGCIHPSDQPLQPVTANNFVLLARLADKYEIDMLIQMCAAFVKDDRLPFDNTHIGGSRLLSMLRAVVDFSVGEEDNSVMTKLLKRAAKLPVAKLAEHEAHSWLPSSAAVALFLAAKENERAEAAAATAAIAHRLRKISSRGFVSCRVCDNRMVHLCIRCTEYVCRKCPQVPCPKALPPVPPRPMMAEVYVGPIHDIDEALII